MPDWLPRIPLGLFACARAVLVPGDAGRLMSERLEWPVVAWRIRWRAPQPAPLRAPVR